MKPVPNFPGYYFTRNLSTPSGWDVFSYKTYGGNVGTVRRTIKQWGGKYGHCYVGFSVNGKKTNTGIHAIVGTYFHGTLRNNNEWCHNDGIPTNNDPKNIRQDTCKGNCADMKRHGTLVDNGGEKNGQNKLTLMAIRVIRRHCETEVRGTKKYLSIIFDVTPQHIGKIVHRKVWVHF